MCDVSDIIGAWIWIILYTSGWGLLNCMSFGMCNTSDPVWAWFEWFCIHPQFVSRNVWKSFLWVLWYSGNRLVVCCDMSDFIQAWVWINLYTYRKCQLHCLKFWNVCYVGYYSGLGLNNFVHILYMSIMSCNPGIWYILISFALKFESNVYILYMSGEFIGILGCVICQILFKLELNHFVHTLYMSANLFEMLACVIW